MAEFEDGPVDRRGFLKGTVASAAAFVAEPRAAGAGEPTQDHDHQIVPSDLTLRVKAIESLLIDKGLVDRAALDVIVDTFETKIGPRNGARIVARAWVDPHYRRWIRVWLVERFSRRFGGLDSRRGAGLSRRPVHCARQSRSDRERERKVSQHRQCHRPTRRQTGFPPSPQSSNSV